MQVETEILRELSYVQPGREFESYKVVAKEIVDEWRWGNVFQVVFTDESDRFWAFTFHDSSGDSEYVEFDDWGETHEVEEVVAIPVTIIKYVPLTDVQPDGTVES